MLSHYSSLTAAVQQVSHMALFGLTLLTAGWSATVYAEPFAYIANYASATVSVVDTDTKAVVATVPVGNGPQGVAVTPDGDRVYVTNVLDKTVSVLNAITNTVVGNPITLGSQPVGAAVTPDGAFVYVVNGNRVSVIATATNTVVGDPIAVGLDPTSVAVSPDGAYVYVTNRSGEHMVSVIDAATKQVVANVPMGENTGAVGVAVTPNGDFLYVTDYFSNTVLVIDAGTAMVDQTIPVESYPVGVTVTPDGDYVYVANSGSNTVSVIDTATNSVVATVPVGNSPAGVAVTPDGAYVYVTNDISDTVSVIDTATNAVVGDPIPVGRQPLSYGQFIGPVVCGNGKIGGGEQCDDGNLMNEDGCSSTCRVEQGYSCGGEPSVCLPANGAPVARCQKVVVSAEPNSCAVASASIDNGSSDPDGDSLTFSQTPAGPYRLGATTVTLTVSDGTLSSQCTSTVNVLDGQAPMLTCPVNQTVPASSSNGAAVSFSPTASDNCGTVITTCTPSSGSIFPLGTTPVTCTVTDGAGAQRSCGFTVTVTADALSQLNSLISTVMGLPISSVAKAVLRAPLLVARIGIQNNQPQLACRALQGFEEIVRQWRQTNRLTAAQAAELTSSSQRIRTTLGCP